MSDFKGKVALVTGAGRGIGASEVRLLAAKFRLEGDPKWDQRRSRHRVSKLTRSPAASSSASALSCRGVQAPASYSGSASRNTIAIGAAWHTAASLSPWPISPLARQESGSRSHQFRFLQPA